MKMKNDQVVIWLQQRGFLYTVLNRIRHPWITLTTSWLTINNGLLPRYKKTLISLRILSRFKSPNSYGLDVPILECLQIKLSDYFLDSSSCIGMSLILSHHPTLMCWLWFNILFRSWRLRISLWLGTMDVEE